MAERTEGTGGKGPTRGRTARTARLGRVAAGGAVRWAGGRLDSRGTEEDQRRRRGDRMVATIDSLVDQLAVMRGAAMKAGQVLSTIEFPGLDEDQAEHLQARLASLRDNVPAVGWKEMRTVLAEEWGEDPEQVLESIDPEHAAAASIGQVYRGRAHDGAEVAIKVQYPGVGEAVESVRSASSGRRPRRSASSRVVTTHIAAPSFWPLALPAVTVDSGSTFRRIGRRAARSSRVVSGRGCSSRSTTRSGLPRRPGTVTGTSSSAKRPASLGRARHAAATAPTARPAHRGQWCTPGAGSRPSPAFRRARGGASHRRSREPGRDDP